MLQLSTSPDTSSASVLSLPHLFFSTSNFSSLTVLRRSLIYSSASPTTDALSVFISCIVLIRRPTPESIYCKRKVIELIYVKRKSKKLMRFCKYLGRVRDKAPQGLELVVQLLSPLALSVKGFGFDIDPAIPNTSHVSGELQYAIFELSPIPTSLSLFPSSGAKQIHSLSLASRSRWVETGTNP
jgi:hypothetical protein